MIDHTSPEWTEAHQQASERPNYLLGGKWNPHRGWLRCYDCGYGIGTMHGIPDPIPDCPTCERIAALEAQLAGREAELGRLRGDSYILDRLDDIAFVLECDGGDNGDNIEIEMVEEPEAFRCVASLAIDRHDARIRDATREAVPDAD